jgi:glutamate dehydrogenase (NADP+)
VAVSGLEMSQNSIRLQWSSQEVDERLREIMHKIFTTCNETAQEYNTTLQAGANIAGFLKVAQAMEAQGIV